jgi:FkbM family methyltransferase
MLKSGRSFWSRRRQEMPSSSVSVDPSLPTVRLDHPGPPIWLYATSNIERRDRARACVKEPWTAEWIETQIRGGDVLYDIGANVGVFSLLAAKRCENDITVVAFEPGYVSYARLCDNIVLNRCETAIIPVPLVLSSSNGLVGFTYRSREPGESRHRLREPFRSGQRRKPGARYEQPTVATKLDDLVERYGLPVPHLIKLDVDGWELHVLEGAQAVLRRPALRSLMIEVQESLIPTVTDLLAVAGFTADARYQRKPRAPVYVRFDRH